MQTHDEFAQGLEVIPGKLYFVWIRRPDSPRFSPLAAANICYCVDNDMLYEPFFADFGPLNLGKAYRFCYKVKQLLQDAERANKRVFFYTGPSANLKANAAVLVGIFQVMIMGRSHEEASQVVAPYKPYVPFRDPSSGVSTFHLTVFDVIKGVAKARDVGFIDWESPTSQFSIDEYEHYEAVEHGDLNWIVPNKLVAFSGPANRPSDYGPGYRALVPEDYWEYYRRKRVTTVVRLNKKVYDRKRFTDGGFQHVDMYFPDGSCPNEAIILRFLDLVETEPGCLAVHCKAGLGRTGVLICCYIMKHYGFTAEEVLGYIRVCRPGSVIGPQQNFLQQMEPRMHRLGDIMRSQGAASVDSPSISSHVEPAGYRARAAASLPDTYSAAPAISGRAITPITPQRYSLSSASSSASTSSSGSSGASILQLQQARQQQQQQQQQAPRYPSAASPMVRSTSVDRPIDRSGVTSAPAGSLRMSINTGPLSAALRQRNMPDHLTASTPTLDSSSPWRLSPPPATTKAGSPAPGMTRTLAPNGQPRKVPMALMGSQGGIGALRNPSAIVGTTTPPLSNNRYSSAFSSFFGR